MTLVSTLCHALIHKAICTHDVVSLYETCQSNKIIESLIVYVFISWALEGFILFYTDL